MLTILVNLFQDTKSEERGESDLNGEPLSLLQQVTIQQNLAWKKILQLIGWISFVKKIV